jgi:hypothetical protein
MTHETLLGLSFEPNKFNGGVQLVLEYGDYELSIVQHDGSHGGKQGLYEIGVFNSRGGVELPGITEPGDTVKGFLTLSDVAIICKKMQTFTGKEPVKVSQ